MKNIEKATLFNDVNKDFNIVSIVYDLLDNIIAYEGVIIIGDGESSDRMVWDKSGRSFSENRGYDLVIKKKI